VVYSESVETVEKEGGREGDVEEGETNQHSFWNMYPKP
jgi:hypothetical protein